jgi:hypothetical protein
MVSGLDPVHYWSSSGKRLDAVLSTMSVSRLQRNRHSPRSPRSWHIAIQDVRDRRDFSPFYGGEGHLVIKTRRENWTPYPESASETYRLSDRRMSAKLVPTIADGECHMVSVTDPYGLNLGFLDRSRHFFFQVAPQFYSRGWKVPVPDPLLLRKSETNPDLWIWSQEPWPLDHRGCLRSST